VTRGLRRLAAGIGRVLLFTLAAVAVPALAQAPTQACRLISVAELGAAGIKLQGGLADDDSMQIDKGTLPGVPSELRIDQCVSPVGREGILPVRLTVAHAKAPLDRRAWKVMNVSLERDEKPAADATSEVVKGTRFDCELLTWPTRTRNLRIHEIVCVGYKDRRQVALAFNEFDRAKLPSVQTVAGLLEKVLGRL
jgi:hypothetical protein